MAVPPPIFIAGSTAVGKSALALALAEKLGGEIISVDSMQVYRGLDIGTAKPSATESARVPHHLIDVVALTDAFDAARFIRLAQVAVDEIKSRGKVPIFCGGTGLYFKAYLEGLGESPPGNEQVRNELEILSMGELLRELEEKDPATYARIDRQNPRRLIRALEVIRVTGKPYSQQRAEWKQAASPIQRKGCYFGIQREADDLRRRIDGRVDDMFRLGLVEETRHLLTQGLEQNRTAMQAIGYRQVVEHLRGERDLTETISLVKQKTWQFARRQKTWFTRQFPQLKWLTLHSEPATHWADAIEREWRAWF